MRRLLRPAQARAGLPHDLPDARCRTGRCVRIHRAVPQSEDATKGRQARPEVLNPFTTVRDFGVEPLAASKTVKRLKLSTRPCSLIAAFRNGYGSWTQANQITKWLYSAA